MRVDNAIILAAGKGERFAPLSYIKHKALWEVRGQVLIERQIEQLREAGVKEIIVVTGYKSESFQYLVKEYGVKAIFNDEFETRNNNGSIWAAREYIANSYICSGDNYYTENIFREIEDDSYYTTQYADCFTDEWCLDVDENDIIRNISLGGCRKWYMIGHSYWDEYFSRKFLKILEKEYKKPETKNKLWESIYWVNIKELPMRICRLQRPIIYEFDSLEELRRFDKKYINNSGLYMLRDISNRLGVEEKDIINICPVREDNKTVGFSFVCHGEMFIYRYFNQEITRY